MAEDAPELDLVAALLEIPDRLPREGDEFRVEIARLRLAPLRGPVDDLTAAVGELQDLKGIGPKYSELIVNGRPYTDIEDFRERSGLPVTLIDKISGNVIFSSE